MGIGNKKKKKRHGRYPEPIQYTDDNMKHVAWCMNNNIIVGFSPLWDTENEWQIDIQINATVSVDPNTYKDDEIMTKVYEYYKYYYDKYNENKI